MLRKTHRLRQLGGGAWSADGSADMYSKPQSSSSSSSSFPVVMMPSRSLWCRQQAVSLREVRESHFGRMVEKLKQTRSYYQYPALCAPQIGWNVQVFTLYDGSVWINPETVSEDKSTMCWTWEVCASQAFMVSYIERPFNVVGGGYNEAGARVEEELTGMRSRLFQHCMDFMLGDMFQRRIPDASHAVPMDGLHAMSEWADDFPSIEARSTNLYTIYIPPMTFKPEYLPDAQLLDRQYQDKIYPGHETFANMMREEDRHREEVNGYLKKLRERDQQ
jgi:peptide deformylase